MANENINEANVNENAEVVEEVITEETVQTVEEVTEASEPQGPYAALGGTVSDQKIPRINKNKVKFGSLATLFTVLFIAIVIAVNVVVTLAAERFTLKVDLTSEHVFTLDQETLDFLAELESPVEIIILGDEQTYRSATSTSDAIAPTRYVIETVDN